MGFLGIFMFAEFTGKQVVRLDVAADSCPIQVEQSSDCDDSKAASASYAAVESRDRDVICSLAEAKAKLSCKELNCPESCPAIFEKTDESLSEYTCFVQGICRCKTQKELELPVEDNSCESLCAIPPENCEPLSIDLSPRIAQKLVEVSDAYKLGSGQGDRKLGDLLRGSACAFGLQYAPVSIRTVADQVKKYSSFDVCGAEVELQPDFTQLSDFLSNPQMPGIKGIAKITKGLTAEVRIDESGSYRAELNLDLCAFLKRNKN